jgi:hypothetical protein
MIGRTEPMQKAGRSNYSSVSAFPTRHDASARIRTNYQADYDNE